MNYHLKPLEFGDIFNYTFRILFRKYFTFIGLMAWIYVPLGLFYSYFYYFFMWETLFVSFEQQLRTILFSMAYMILQQLVLGPLAQGGVIKVATGVFFSEDVRFMEAVRALFSNRIWLTLILLGIVVGICVIFGFIALILPGIFLTLVFSMASPAAMLEGEGVWRSLSRSFSLVLKDFWRVSLVFLVMGLITYLTTAVVSAPLSVAMSVLMLIGTEHTILLAVLGFFSNVLGVLAAPIPIIAITLLFHDLRMRHEGMDLAHRVQALTDGERA